MNLKIAFLQLMPEKSTKENMEKGAAACRKAAAMGADIALFPEMFNCGYNIPQDKDELDKKSIDKESGFVKAFKDLSAELSMAIGITFLEKGVKGFLNSVIVFDRTGKEVLHYSKVHTCAFDAERVLCGGDGFYVSELDFGRGKVNIGAMICFDREFPESARALMLKGAELILAPNACPMEINRLSALRARAYENMVAVATCNYPTGQPDCNGRSSLFDGVPWLPDEPGIRDMCAFLAPGSENVYLAELDIEQLRRHRAHDVMGKKYRRPGKYGILSEEI